MSFENEPPMKLFPSIDILFRLSIESWRMLSRTPFAEGPLREAEGIDEVVPPHVVSPRNPLPLMLSLLLVLGGIFV